MKNKTKKQRILKRQIPKKSQSLFDDSYMNKLPSEAQDWLNQFHDGVCRNNHRKHEIFTKHPEYETRIKSELDRETNIRNKSVYLDPNDSFAIYGVESEEYISEQIENYFLGEEEEKYILDFKNTEKEGDTLKNMLTQFSNEYNIGERVLLTFITRIIKLIKLENKHRL